MTYQNEFDEPQRGGFLANVGPKAAFFIVLIALSFMIGVVWKLYSGGDKSVQNVPIVRADEDSFKVVPDDPGGMEIRHKDSTLFSSIKNKREEEGGRIENLLADDENEEPMPRSQLFAGLNTEPNTDLERNDTPTPLDQPMGVSVSEEIEPVVEEEEEPKPKLKEEEKIVIKLAPEPEAEPEPEPEPEPESELKLIVPAPVKVEPAPKNTPSPTPAKTEASGNYYVQLASTKDKTSAEAEWKKLSQKYSAIIGDLSHRIETANLGAKGVYHRIQVGPLNQESAISKCLEIKKVTPSGCLVTK